MSANPDRIRCPTISADGTSCRAWAVRGSDPPRCAPHGGGKQRCGAPRGNLNALKHGFYSHVLHRGEAADLERFGDELSLEDEISIARITLRRAMALLDHPELDVADLSQVAALVLLGTRTVARLLRDQRAISGASADAIAGAIGVALDELGTEWGINL